MLFYNPAPGAQGFLCSNRHKDDQGYPIPFLVPGPAADASVGIALAHFKSPLQDVVRAAQAAERRAKKQLGRSAVAVTLFKRSGETIEWGARWESGGLQLYRAIALGLESEQLSGKFPYRFAELLSPYVTETTPLVKVANMVQTVHKFNNGADVVRVEFAHVLSRQRGPSFPSAKLASELLVSSLKADLDNYLAGLETKPEEMLQYVIGLCQTVAFAHRTRNGKSRSAHSSAPATTNEKQTQP